MNLQRPNFENPFYDFEKDSRFKNEFNSLKEDGLAIIDFPEENLDKMISNIKSNLDPIFKKTSFGNQRIQDAWKFNDDVKRIALNCSVLEILEETFGRKPIPFQTLNFPCGTQQSSHSDHVHFSSIPKRFMCGVWLAMEDIDEENGPLFYYPGSHKWPSIANEDLGINGSNIKEKNLRYNDFVDYWDQLAKSLNIEKQHIHAKKGQAIIWASNLVHGGSEIKDFSRSRWSQVTHYFFEDCVYYTPLLSDCFYGEVMFRNIIDISTGEVVENYLNGRKINSKMSEDMLPRFYRKRNLSNIFKRVLNKIRSV